MEEWKMGNGKYFGEMPQRVPQGMPQRTLRGIPWGTPQAHHKKRKFSLRVFSVNMTRSVGNYAFGNIY